MLCSDFPPDSPGGGGEDSAPGPRSSLCLFLDTNLGFGELWWLLGLLQLTPLLPLLVLYR